ncbi:DUF2570 domain-containing protein [Erwinia sp. STN24]|uniref:DUF2570 domain-containing protein n=1 Tax=Erwinia sp. STN24 TaxID=3233996 RepID=UPI003521D8A3
MKLLTTVLAILLLVALQSAGFYCGYKRGLNEAEIDYTRSRLRDSEAAIDEMRWLVAESRAALLAVQESERKRNEDGEARREKIQAAIQSDGCAGTVVPANVSNELLRRKTAGSDADNTRSGAGKFDHADASAAAGNAGNVGRDSNLE